MNRISLLCIASFTLFLFGCDVLDSGTSPESSDSLIEVEVTSLGIAQSASVELGSIAYNNVALPWTHEQDGAQTYQLSVRGDNGPVEVTVTVDNRIREVKRGEMVVLHGHVKSNEVEVRGSIEAVDSVSVSVQGLTFALTDSTRAEDRNGAPLALSALQVGDYVEVEGYRNADGLLLAREIELEWEDDDDAFEEIEVEGMIESLDMLAGLLRVEGFDFIVNDSTRIEGDDSSLTFEALQVGDYVEVEGYRSENGDLVASEIELEENEREDDDSSDDSDDDDSDDDDSDDD